MVEKISYSRSQTQTSSSRTALNPLSYLFQMISFEYIVTKLAKNYNWATLRPDLGFGDLDLILKVTVGLGMLTMRSLEPFGGFAQKKYMD